ncbi:MAG: CpXC domain-containing protein [Kofleriaceae bacterium]
MSTWTERELACACGQTIHARVAVGAHVGRAPQVRTAILERSFHRFACGCGAAVVLDTQFEYFDLDRRQLVLVGAASDREAWPDLERRLRDTVLRALEWGSPLTSDLVARLVPRVVFGLEALREKLILADAGLDDGLIECVKIRAIANDPELSRGRMRIEAVTSGDALHVRHEARSDVFELPASWVHAALHDRASLENRFPALFGGGYVDLARFWKESA